MKLLTRKTAIARSVCIVMLSSAGCILAGPRHAHSTGEGSWHELEARIQNGYFTEDMQGLEALEPQVAARVAAAKAGADKPTGENTAPDKSAADKSAADKSGAAKAARAAAADRLGGYYSALLAYRETQLAVRIDSDSGVRPLMDAEKTQVLTLLARCVSSLEPVLAAQKDYAEGLALQGACLAMSAELDSFWHAPLTAVRGGSQLRRALQLAPGNPRVVLLHAMASAGRDAERTIGELKKAIEGFEAERQGAAHLPSWGAAEAYELIARTYLQRGDTLPARDALEHSLLLAPAYVRAHRLLLQITS